MQITEQRSISAYYDVSGDYTNPHQSIAYRTSRSVGRSGRKIIKCPNSLCNRRLTDVDERTKVKLVALPSKSVVKCQNYQKCIYCGIEVGFNYI